MNIGLISYGMAGVAFLVLSLLLAVSWRGKIAGIYIIIASILTSIWAGLWTASFLTEANLYSAVWLVEYFRDVAWLVFLWKFFHTPESEELPVARNKDLIFFTCLFLLFLLIFIAPVIVSRFADFLGYKDLVFIGWISLSIIGMLLIEQIFRNSDASERWKIKYLCIGLGSIYAYDFYIFSTALLFKDFNFFLLNTRGILNTIAVPLIAISIARAPKLSIDIHVSRDIVFHSTTIVGAGIYLLVMALIGYAIRFYGGSWGNLLQIFFFLSAGILLAILLFSENIRKKLRVFLNKNFFSLKYDYREQWLQFTNALSEKGTSVPEKIIYAIGSMFDSPGGLLLEHTEDSFTLVGEYNLGAPRDFDPIALKPLSRFLLSTFWVIDLDEFRETPQNYQNLALPAWMTSNKDLWIIVPLRLQSSLSGIVLLRRSKILKTLNWEDRDLLKLAGQQAATHLSQYQADLALSNARQFEAFNRLSAYVIHDLKNILSQQSLLLSNADKHRNNPRFIDDVFETIGNSVERMKRLMEQMRSASREGSLSKVEIGEMLKKVISKFSSFIPQPTLTNAQPRTFTFADQDQLVNVFSHLIQNAIEATDNTGSVSISYQCSNESITVEIIDSGTGMTQEFIKDRLFKPFDSTKGLTGMGIGAYESLEYIRSLGGDISVTSALGQGSTFKVLLPLVDIDHP